MIPALLGGQRRTAGSFFKFSHRREVSGGVWAVAADIDLSGQIALITGGGRGIGKEFASALARAGAAVAITARTEAQVNEAAADIEATGGRCLPFTADVTDLDHMRRVVCDVEEDLGPIDLLVNNAAIITPLGYDWNIDVDEWWQSFNVNVRGPYLCTRLVLPGMMARKRGRIVNVSSSSAHSANPEASAYCASKAALSSFTASLARAVNSYGISVFALAPSGRTSMTEYVTRAPEVSQKARESARAFIDTDPEAKMQASVDMLLFLASGRADRLTGRHISRTDSQADLLAKADEIVEKNLYVLSLKK